MAWCKYPSAGPSLCIDLGIWGESDCVAQIKLLSSVAALPFLCCWRKQWYKKEEKSRPLILWWYLLMLRNLAWPSTFYLPLLFSWHVSSVWLHCTLVTLTFQMGHCKMMLQFSMLLTLWPRVAIKIQNAVCSCGCGLTLPFTASLQVPASKCSVDDKIPVTSLVSTWSLAQCWGWGGLSISVQWGGGE